MHSLDTMGLITFSPTRGVNGQYSNESLVFSTVRPEITHVARDASAQDVEDPKSLELIFGQKHNDIDCALCPTAKRACNRAWFSAKQVENWSEMSKMTLWRWLERIEKARRISLVSDMKLVGMSTSTGADYQIEQVPIVGGFS